MSGVAFAHPGDVVAGRFRVEGTIGAGGFGVVLRATQLALGREVALKMLFPETLARRGGVERFRREAELAQRLAHPNTVRLFDFGTTEQGVPFIAWELLRGEPLSSAIRAAGRFDVARTLRVASQILKSLAEAHALGIVHRDLKPDNVLLCEFAGERDWVKVLDFGLAKEQGGKELTERGVIVGTPAYMAPEQVRGESVDATTDLYALGLVMAEMLSGRVVFGASVAIEVAMAQISSLPVPLPPEVLDSPLGAILHRATRKEPSQRFATAGEMLAALEAIAVASAPTMQQPLVATPIVAPVPTFAGAPTAQAPSYPGGASPFASSVPPYAAPTPALGPYATSGAMRPFATTPAPAPIPTAQAPRATGLIAAIAALGVLLVVAITAAILFATGAVSLSVGEPPKAPPAVPAGGAQQSGVVDRRFANLSNKELKRRMEAAGFKVLDETSQRGFTMWNVDAGTVLLTRYDDRDVAQMSAQTKAMSGAIVALDGTAELQISLLDLTAGKKLLDAMTR